MKRFRFSGFQFPGRIGRGENPAPPRRRHRRDAGGTSGGWWRGRPTPGRCAADSPRSRAPPDSPPLGCPAPPPAPAEKCDRIHAGRHKGHIGPGDSTTVWNALLNGHAAFAVVCPASNFGHFRVAPTNRLSVNSDSQYGCKRPIASLMRYPVPHQSQPSFSVTTLPVSGSFCGFPLSSVTTVLINIIPWTRLK